MLGSHILRIIVKWQCDTNIVQNWQFLDYGTLGSMTFAQLDLNKGLSLNGASIRKISYKILMLKYYESKNLTRVRFMYFKSDCKMTIRSLWQLTQTLHKIDNFLLMAALDLWVLHKWNENKVLGLNRTSIIKTFYKNLMLKNYESINLTRVRFMYFKNDCMMTISSYWICIQRFV